jgi:AcrR family transcriptional regulator
MQERKRRIRRSERRKLIMAEATKLFAHKGFHAATVDEIAAATKISKPVLYDHFSSKQELYLEVCKEIRERLLAAGREVILPPQSLGTRIRAGVEAFFLFGESNPEAIRILLSPPRDEVEVFRAVEAIQDEATESIMKLVLAVGVAKPEDDDGLAQFRVQMEFIKQGLHALAEWRQRHGDVPRRVVVEGISSLIESGLKTEGTGFRSEPPAGPGEG